MESNVVLDSQLQRVVERYGTPTFVYFTDRIEQRIASLQQAFGGKFQLSYAVKSNPNPALLRWLNGRVELLDVSSIGELRLALQAGWDASRLSFTGPGKREFELREAIQAGVGELVVESVREAQRASVIAGSQGRVQDILVRIAPDRVPKGFGDQMAGRPSAFGIDQEQINGELPKILDLQHLRLVGLHIYSGTQCLKAEAVCENYQNFIKIFEEVCGRYGIAPQKLVFGSGLGIPYHDGDQALDLNQVGNGIRSDLDALQRKPLFANATLVLELGRYLVGEAGFFLTRVVTVKESRGSRIAICDGGMNNHLPATGHFGMVIQRNYRMHKVGGAGDCEKVDLVGPLCTSIDRLGRGVMLPRLVEGDIVAVHQSGSYGLTASPIHFISHSPPSEVLVAAGELQNITRSFGSSLGD